MSPENHQLEHALEVLEVKVAYQEDTIEQLNQTLIKQQDQIDEMRHLLNVVVEKLKTATQTESDINDQVELPPHY